MYTWGQAVKGKQSAFGAVMLSPLCDYFPRCV